MSNSTVMRKTILSIIALCCVVAVQAQQNRTKALINAAIKLNSAQATTSAELRHCLFRRKSALLKTTTR